MDALQMLKKDHETVKEILDQLEDCPPTALKRRERLFARLKEELSEHETIEEEILYPALREIAAARELVNEAYEEHNLVDHVLDDMANVPFDDEAFDAKLAVAKENILHHIQEEEGDLFRRAREALDADELDELRTRMEERKAAMHG